MKLRVLHCIYDDPGNPWVAGGGSVRVLELYRRLVGRLESVTVATGAYPASRDETIDGIRYRRLGSRSPYAWSRLSYSMSASRMLARAPYDVAVYDFSTYTPLRLPRTRPVGVTVHHLTGMTATERWGGTVGRVVAGQELKRLRSGRIFSATSRITEERLRTLLGPQVEIRRVEAGVADELFELPRRESDYLLYFGRLDWHHKGLDVLLSAVRILAAERSALRVKIAGRGKDFDRVVQQTYALGIRDHVEVIGAVDDRGRNELFAGARLLLMPSRFEGFGMVAAEAMAAGVPIVASDAGSLPEVLAAPDGGEVVPAGDAVALAQRAAALLADPQRRRALGRRARQSAERYRWSRVAEQHLEFLEAIRASGARHAEGV